MSGPDQREAGAAFGRALVPCAVAVALWLLDRRSAAAIAALSTVVLVALGLAAPGAVGRFDEVLHRSAAALARAISWSMSTACWVLVVLPVWALSRLVGFSPLDPGWASERSAWTAARPSDRHAAPGGSTRVGSADTALAPGQQRRLLARRCLVAAVALIAAVAILAGELLPLRSGGDSSRDAVASATIDFRGGTTDGPVTFAGLPVDSYAHEEEPFAVDLFREINAVGGNLRPDPIVGVRTPDFRGAYVNVVDGRRASYTPEEPTWDVWFFGGSTMFGIGQRDEHTIPSVVARLAEADGVRIRATNFGVSGDVNWQETIRFAEALKGGRPEPDLVVFYDGWNDESLGQYRAEIGSLDPSVSERLPFSDLDRAREPMILGRRQRLGPGPEQVALGIPLAAEQYARGVRTARALGAAEGIEVVHFWQPIAAVKQYAPSDDELLRRTGLRARWRNQRVDEYAAIHERSGVDPIDLSAALDDVDRPVYIDQGHTNELGARVVGEAMYAELLPRLRDLDDG